MLSLDHESAAIAAVRLGPPFFAFVVGPAPLAPFESTAIVAVWLGPLFLVAVVGSAPLAPFVLVRR